MRCVLLPVRYRSDAKAMPVLRTSLMPCALYVLCMCSEWAHPFIDCLIESGVVLVVEFAVMSAQLMSTQSTLWCLWCQIQKCNNKAIICPNESWLESTGSQRVGGIGEVWTRSKCQLIFVWLILTANWLLANCERCQRCWRCVARVSKAQRQIDALFPNGTPLRPPMHTYTTATVQHIQCTSRSLSYQLVYASNWMHTQPGQPWRRTTLDAADSNHSKRAKHSMHSLISFARYMTSELSIVCNWLCDRIWRRTSGSCLAWRPHYNHNHCSITTTTFDSLIA